MMNQRSVRWMAMGVFLASLVTLASALDTTCTLTSMRQDSLAPATLAFPVPTHGEQLPLTIDETTGAVTVNFGSLPVLTFPNSFSSPSDDTIFFQDETVTGTIDAGGNIVLPHVRGINCTQGNCPDGTPTPCPCVFGNVCSNNVTRVCAAIGGENLDCPPVDPDPNPGVCQGVCSNDRTTTCASDLDCAPPGYCGQGVAMRIDANFTTGAPTFEGFTVVGKSNAFGDGSLKFVSVGSTPPETYGIGDGGVTMLTFSCDLEPVPSPSALPPAGWTVKKGTIKLGTGAAGDADDSLSLKGSFVPDGDVDFIADDLAITLANDTALVATLLIPKGRLVANGKGNKWKLVDKDGSVVTITPALPDGSAPSHKVSVKKGKTGVYSIGLSSKNLNLDGADVDAITTGLSIGIDTPSQESVITAKKSKRTF